MRMQFHLLVEKFLSTHPLTAVLISTALTGNMIWGLACRHCSAKISITLENVLMVSSLSWNRTYSVYLQVSCLLCGGAILVAVVFFLYRCQKSAL
jgi:hypothetical protein